VGCRDFAVLFDDIPDIMAPAPADRKQSDSLASLHSQVTNTIYQWSRGLTPDGRFLFCPTPYCGRMAERELGGADYLETIGRQLLPEIDVLWTGPEIVSREIPLAHLEDVRAKLRRRPVLWDNLYANDYDGRRFFCGPYAGRPSEVKTAVNGILANPNCEFPLNFVPLRTMADFIRRDSHWDPRKAYLAAMKQWLARFATSGPPVSFEDLVLLGDCHYLPYEEGPEAERLYQEARRLIATDLAGWNKDAAAFQEQATGLRDCCTRLAELRDRPLFYALSRRLWELREELDLLLGWIRLRRENREAGSSWRSDFHLPNTYRGGLLRRLERLLIQQADGTFTPAESSPDLSLSPGRDRPGRTPSEENVIGDERNKTANPKRPKSKT
jgi:protein O-GlcNAcase/histone acetyltransferase